MPWPDCAPCHSLPDGGGGNRPPSGQPNVPANSRQSGLRVPLAASSPRYLALTNIRRRSQSLPAATEDRHRPPSTPNRARTIALPCPYRPFRCCIVIPSVDLGLDKGAEKDRRFVWADGRGVWPFGLNRLESARQAGYLLIVEGATDYAACVMAGLPTLGVPGASSWRKDWASYIRDIPRVVVWREPGQGGATLVDLVTDNRSNPAEVAVVVAPPEAKDPCVLRQMDPDGFPQKMADLIAGAVPPNLGEQGREEQDPWDSLPEIVTTGKWLREITQEAWHAVRAANEPPFIFRRGRLLVDVVADDDCNPVLRTLDKTAFKGVLDRIANFTKETDGGLTPARPPWDLMGDMMSAKELPLPVLLGVVRAPIFTREGSLVTTPGYHANVRAYLDLPKDLVIPAVSSEPTLGEIGCSVTSESGRLLTIVTPR